MAKEHFIERRDFREESMIRREKLRKVKRQMLNEYERWKKQEASQEEPEEIDC